MLQRETLENQIHELCDTDLRDEAFLERIAKSMLCAIGAAKSWTLRVKSADRVDSLANDADDDAQLKSLIVSDARLKESVKWSAQHRRVSNLTISNADSIDVRWDVESNVDPDLIQQRIDSEKLDLFFVPVKCSVEADLVVCLCCPADETGCLSKKQQLTLFTKLSELRFGSADHADVHVGVEAEASIAKQISAVRETSDSYRSAFEFSNSVSGSLEKEKSAFLLANALKGHLDVDRVSVIEQTGSQTRVLAVSGQPTFNRRSNVVRYTQFLAKVILKSGEALWFSGDQDELSPPMQKAVGRYLEESLVQNFTLIPIRQTAAPIYPSEEQSLVELVNPGRTAKTKVRGAILLENIQKPIEREKVEKRWEQVAVQTSNQFNNAKRFSDLFMLPFVLVMTKLIALYRGHTARKAWGLSLIALALIAAGCLIKTDFVVRCEGYLQPLAMNHVFVGKDGVVMDVLVKEGATVRAGDPLVRLQNRQLELELAEIKGALKEKKQTLEHVMFRRANHRTDGDSNGETYSDLAERTGLIEKQITSLEKTLGLKQSQLDDLVVSSPADGQIMGWNVDRKYLNRPLPEGTRLFSVANVDQEKVLELKVPEKRARHITHRRAKRGDDSEKFSVEFSIASLPDKRFSAQVSHINRGLEPDSDLGYVLPIEAKPTSKLPRGLRAGVPVVAKVVCGKRSFLYCKSYEFVDWMHRMSFTYF